MTDTDDLLKAISVVTSRQSTKAFRRMPPSDAVHLVGRVAKTLTVVLANIAMRPPGAQMDPDVAHDAAVALERIASVIRAVGEVHGLARQSMTRRARAQ